MKIILRTLVLSLALVIAGCGANAGRCELWTPGYPLCGI